MIIDKNMAISKQKTAAGATTAPSDIKSPSGGTDEWTCPCDENPEYNYINEHIDGSDRDRYIEKNDEVEGMVHRLPKSDLERYLREEEQEQRDYDYSRGKCR